LLQFSFWETKAPKFWELLKFNHLAFFKDIREISLNKLTSIVADSSKKSDPEVSSTGFWFQKAKPGLSDNETKNLQVKKFKEFFVAH
jgi:hypothetical protein